MVKYFILSIDGGGLRGVIPSVFLSALKEMLEKRGLKKPFHQIFDLMAGTSTGGLISLALSVPLYKEPNGELYDSDGGISARQLPELYRVMGDRAFPGNRHQVLKLVRQIFTSKYGAIPFQQILYGLFQSCTVKNALTNILITSFDMRSMQPVFIKKRPKNTGGDSDPDFYMVDAALSTAAVPTYFPPAYTGYADDSTARFCLVDGGIFCLNPAMCALTEARKIFPGGEYVILSLGTGIQTQQYKTENINRWGFFNWIAPWLNVPLISAVGDGQRISTNHMLKKLPGVVFIRIDVELDRGKGRIDDGSAENLDYLRSMAEKMIEENRASMERIVDMILQQKK